MRMHATSRSWASRSAALAGLVLGSLCARAHAYQNPTRFADPPELGGGGGKFFTGSPADGYTCKVCHSEGKPTHLTIQGLPVSGYVPGTTYRITVDWIDDLKSVALNFEITDNQGHTAGTLAMPGIDELGPGDLCQIGFPDVQVMTTMADGRSIGVVGECGGHQATVDWTAPVAAPTGSAADSEVWFTGSLVSADADGTVAGDNVTDFSRVIGPRGQAAPLASQLAAGCSTAAGRRAPWPWALCAALALLWLRRRRCPG